MNEPKPRTVELLPDRVIKHFKFPDDFFRELDVYRLDLPFTPKMLDFREPEWIALSHANGQPYLDLEEGFDPGSLAEVIAALHLAKVESGKHICHIDNQPANILYDGHQYTLLDFADSRMDYPETDISHLLLFWAEEFETERFKNLTSRFMETYLSCHMLHPDTWRRCLEQSRSRFFTRRALYSKAAAKLPATQREANQRLLDGLLS